MCDAKPLWQILDPIVGSLLFCTEHVPPIGRHSLTIFRYYATDDQKCDHKRFTRAEEYQGVCDFLGLDYEFHG